MNITLRRTTAALLALWGVSVLLVDGRIGWALLVLLGAWLLWRRPRPAPSRPAAPPSPTPPTARPVRQAVTPVEPVPYWLLPTAAVAGAAAVMHDRDQPVADASEEPAGQEEEEEAFEESYDAAGHAAPAAGWHDLDDADAEPDVEGFGGDDGGGDWGGDDGGFGGDGGGGDWGGDDW